MHDHAENNAVSLGSLLSTMVAISDYVCGQKRPSISCAVMLSSSITTYTAFITHSYVLSDMILLYDLEATT